MHINIPGSLGKGTWFMSKHLQAKHLSSYLANVLLAIAQRSRFELRFLAEKLLAKRGCLSQVLWGLVLLKKHFLCKARPNFR